jgi:hypothetical protein
MAPATLTWLGERQGNTGRSGSAGHRPGRAGGSAMGEALTIGARHERGYAIVTVGGEIDMMRLLQRRVPLSA